jgi:hypothetical protein
MATPRNRSTRPERAIPTQPMAGVPAMIDPDPIPRPIEYDEPAAIAERAWLERDSMAAAVDYRSDWAFFD